MTKILAAIFGLLAYCILAAVMLSLQGIVIWFISYTFSLCFNWKQLTFWPESVLLGIVSSFIFKVIKRIFQND